MTFAVALSFDCGILLCADSKDKVPARIHLHSTKIFPRQYGSNPCYARSIFLISKPVAYTVAAIQHCERALDALQLAEYTMDRMRATIENALFEIYQKPIDSQLQSKPDATLLIALYSPTDRQCSLFRTNGTALRELIGYDCQGTAAYLGHCLIRDRYRAAESMDALDLTTVFSIAIETLEAIKEYRHGCGRSAEIIVMYADGRVSEVQRIRQDTENERKLALIAGVSGA